MIHLFIMLYIVALTLWLSAFVVCKVCADADAAWARYYKTFQYSNRKLSINTLF